MQKRPQAGRCGRSDASPLFGYELIYSVLGQSYRSKVFLETLQILAGTHSLTL